MRPAFIKILCIVALVFLAPPHCQKYFAEDNPFGMQIARCVLLLDDYRSNRISYSTGFNYEVLRAVGDRSLVDFEITLGDGYSHEYWLDALTAGEVDMLVMPAADTCIHRRTDLKFSPLMADGAVWVTSVSSRLAVNSLYLNISRIKNSSYYKALQERFEPKYEPYSRAARGYKYKYASPYDSLIKDAAKELGWDWRMLAALIWQESMFRIEAHSKRGALGLLQLMEQTAIAYNGSPERLEPESNLAAGTKYLKKLQRMFAADASTPEELVHFVLAAFNAGEGRIKDCIQYAESKGLPHSTWTDLKRVIPMMRDTVAVDSLRLGVFKGVETIAHVDRTDSLYRAFCIIAP